jgi:hypothetical protein
MPRSPRSRLIPTMTAKTIPAKQMISRRPNRQTDGQTDRRTCMQRNAHRCGDNETFKPQETHTPSNLRRKVSPYVVSYRYEGRR